MVHSWKRVLSYKQMGGTRLVRPGHTWSSTCHMLRVTLVWHLMILIKDTVFYTTTSRIVTWLVVFSQERQVLCPGLPQDDLQDSVMIARTLHPPSLSLAREVVLVTSNRTVVHSIRGLILSYFRILTFFKRLASCGSSRISSRHLRSRIVLNNFACVCNITLSLLLKQ